MQRIKDAIKEAQIAILRRIFTYSYRINRWYYNAFTTKATSRSPQQVKRMEEAAGIR